MSIVSWSTLVRGFGAQSWNVLSHTRCLRTLIMHVYQTASLANFENICIYVRVIKGLILSCVNDVVRTREEHAVTVN